MKFNEAYDNFIIESSIFDPIKPEKIEKTQSGKNRILSFITPAGNKVSVVFREYPNNEAELSFKVNDDTNADPDRGYDKDIARMILWVVKDELKDQKYDEIGIFPEYDIIDRSGLQRKRTFIKMINRYITNYQVIDYDDEESDFTIVPKENNF